MLEHAIIKYMLLDKNIYINYYNNINIKYIKENYKELYKLFICLDRYYNNHTEASSISISELEAEVLNNYPMIKDGERLLLSSLLHKIDTCSHSEQSIVAYLQEHRNRCIAGDLAIQAFEYSEGRKPFSVIEDTFKSFEKSTTSSLEEAFGCSSVDLVSIMEKEEQEPGFNWRLECLNISLGPLRKANFGHIFARIETGKTAMWVSECTHMLSQIPEDKTLGIFFNEEDGNGTIIRLYSALLKLPFKEILRDIPRYRNEFMEKGGYKIRFFDRGHLKRNEIEQIVSKINPALIVIDNMDKLEGFEADRNDLVLWEIYKWGRALAKEYCPVLSVGQADATADGRKWINENQMDGGKTGKPSETDFTIGIGRTRDEGMDSVRHIHISRNKLRGGEKTIPAHRHGKFDVLLKSELSIYEDINTYS